MLGKNGAFIPYTILLMESVIVSKESLTPSAHWSSKLEDNFTIGSLKNLICTGLAFGNTLD